MLQHELFIGFIGSWPIINPEYPLKFILAGKRKFNTVTGVWRNKGLLTGKFNIEIIEKEP